MSDELLRVQDLCKAFPIGGGFLEGRKRWLKAVDRVSLHLDRGETLGLVGESGSGKSTVEIGRASCRERVYVLV